MTKYTITLAEVRTYADGLPEGAPAGVSCSSRRCLVAQAVLAKYPRARWAVVYPYNDGVIDIRLCARNGRVVSVETPDAEALAKLANSFDGLPSGPLFEVSKEQVLPLFE